MRKPATSAHPGPDGIAPAQQLVHGVRAIGAPRRRAARAERVERAESAIADRVVEQGAAE